MVELLKLDQNGIQDSSGNVLRLRDLELKLVQHKTYQAGINKLEEDVATVTQKMSELAKVIGGYIGADYALVDVTKNTLGNSSPGMHDPAHEFLQVTSSYYCKRE